MVNLKNFKKGQSLPLNTIVIAILVIIVLLVIIVFFTSNVGKTGNQINEQSAASCSDSNPALSTIGYTDIEEYPENSGCPSGTNRISIIPTRTEDDIEYICCGTK
ncbi:MAG: hypothetical protein PF569_05040 [Candidatus Woesearchaeota archaeon]|jgi:hypothetical protein|nr:hypothetical protein [Candidatus Woesearchaeota archaeon]